MLQVRRPPVCPPVLPHDSVGGSAERAGGSILAPRPPPAHLRRAPLRPAVLDRDEGAAHRRRATSLAQLGQDMTAARRLSAPLSPPSPPMPNSPPCGLRSWDGYCGGTECGCTGAARDAARSVHFYAQV